MITPNIIIMNCNEKVIRWLDSDLADVEETNEANKCRKIKLTYPYENNVVLEDQVQWYEQGNKIYVPSINGITGCLYVINTEYDIDFWHENTVTVEAEEILVETNYDVISFKAGTVVNLTKEKLSEWFGSYYDIGTVDALGTRKQVSPEGVMTRMSLLRLIEEQTERKFITSYINKGNVIKRTLDLRNTDSDDFQSKTPALDLNYNLESLEFTKSEENTYNAIAPIFQEQTVTAETVNNSTNAQLRAEIVRHAENNVKRDTTSKIQLKELVTQYLAGDNDNNGNLISATTQTKTPDELLQEWIDYEVMTGEEIPMIIKEQNDGSVITTAKWNAPFTKYKGELYIVYEGEGSSNYTGIISYNRSVAKDKYKIATMNTNEQLVQSIYNDLAISLLAKLAPKFQLKIDVKDIQMLLDNDNLGYQLHEKLEVRVPNFNYFVPCVITETVKNLHLPGENKITVETDVTSMLKLYNSIIHSNDLIISSYDTATLVGGTLFGEEDTLRALANKTVTLNVKLDHAYDSNTVGNNVTLQQSYSTFNPSENTYYFSEEEISNLEKALRYNLMTNGNTGGNYRIRDVDGNIYSINGRWAVAIYVARNQLYINNEEVYGGSGSTGLGKGYFEPTIIVHYYGEGVADTKLKELAGDITYEQAKKYYASYYYDNEERMRQFFMKHIGEDVGYSFYSYEAQNGSTCVPAACSAVSSKLFTYHTEYELARLMGTTNQGTSWDSAISVMESLGFKCQIVEATEDNIKKYITVDSAALIGINPAKLSHLYYNGHYKNTADGYHAIVLAEWYYNSDFFSQAMVQILDSNLPKFNPLFLNTDMGDDWVSTNIILNAATAFYSSTGWTIRESGTHHMIVVSNTNANKPSASELQSSTVNIDSFNPAIKNYNFNFNTVRTGILESIKSNVLSGDTSNPMNLFTGVKSSEGVSYTLSMYWLRAISLAYLYSYFGTTDKSSNKVVRVSNDSNSKKYYDHTDLDVARVGTYDWFTPVNPEKASYSSGYFIASALFMLGFPYSPNDFTGNTGTWSDISNTITSKAGSSIGSVNLHTWTITNTKTNINKYLNKQYSDNFNYTIILAYAKNSALSSNANVNMTSYPIILYSVDGSTVEYYNVMSQGNSVGNNYNTSKTSDANPYKTTTLDNIVSWISSASSEAPNGSANNLLVVSWFTKKELGGQ